VLQFSQGGEDVSKKKKGQPSEPESDETLINSTYYHIQLILMRMKTDGKQLLNQMITQAEHEILDTPIDPPAKILGLH